MPCPGLAEHLLVVYMYETSYLSIKISLDCVHAMVMDVAVTMVTVKALGASGMTPVINKYLDSHTHGESLVKLLYQFCSENPCE